VEAEEKSIELAVSGPGELEALQERLRHVPGASVSRVSGRPLKGELGAPDVLTVIGSSSGLVAAIGMIPAYLRARRSGVEIKTVVKGEKFTVTATNVSDVMPIIERMLKESAQSSDE
jgi:hypothetical protein